MTRFDSVANSARACYSSPEEKKKKRGGKRLIFDVSFSFFSSLHIWIILHLSLLLSGFPLSLFPSRSHSPVCLTFPVSSPLPSSPLHFLFFFIYIYIQSHPSLSFLIASLFTSHSQHIFPHSTSLFLSHIPQHLHLCEIFSSLYFIASLIPSHIPHRSLTPPLILCPFPLLSYSPVSPSLCFMRSGFPTLSFPWQLFFLSFSLLYPSLYVTHYFKSSYIFSTFKQILVSCFALALHSLRATLFAIQSWKK